MWHPGTLLKLSESSRDDPQLNEATFCSVKEDKPHLIPSYLFLSCKVFSWLFPDSSGAGEKGAAERGKPGKPPHCSASHSFPSPVEGPPHLRLTHEDIRVSGQQCKPKVSTRGQCKLLQKCQTTAPVCAGHDDHRRAKVPLQLWLPEPLCDCTTRRPVLLGASPASLGSRQLDVKQVMAWRASGLR